MARRFRSMGIAEALSTRVSDGPRRIGARTSTFREVAVMAIINRTPDSFFDKGATFDLDKTVDASIMSRG
ncbi:MAG: folP [Burkholderiales bacterium]|nr:folP [Burkholderiales bacterium]